MLSNLFGRREHPHQEAPPPNPIAKALGDRTLHCAFIGGIVNPLGPTLTALAFDSESGPGPGCPIVRIDLNPFSQAIEQIGVSRWSDTGDPIAWISPFLGSTFDECPTLLLSGTCYAPGEEEIAIFSSLLVNKPDGHRTLDAVRRFAGDPWSRIDEAVAAGLAGLDGEESPACFAGLRFTEADARELARIQLEPTHASAELQVFMHAWKGSVDFHRHHGIAFPDTMAFDDFIAVFARLTMSCRIPELRR